MFYNIYRYDFSNDCYYCVCGMIKGKYVKKDLVKIVKKFSDFYNCELNSRKVLNMI